MAKQKRKLTPKQKAAKKQRRMKKIYSYNLNAITGRAKKILKTICRSERFEHFRFKTPLNRSLFHIVWQPE